MALIEMRTGFCLTLLVVLVVGSNLQEGEFVSPSLISAIIDNII